MQSDPRVNVFVLQSNLKNLGKGGCKNESMVEQRSHAAQQTIKVWTFGESDAKRLTM
jgi:hypothetical protein